MTNEEHPAFSEKSILIADDNARNAELLEAFLDPLGCDIRIASDGAEALRLAREARPDLALLDIMMPEMSGYQVCEAFRADDTLRDVPIIVVTALTEPNDVERSLEAGADDFLTKPIDREELLVRVRAHLRGSPR
ncbi:MAG: response regulator [Planctomycetota bacterium]